jgi:hypothetical protein
MNVVAAFVAGKRPPGLDAVVFSFLLTELAGDTVRIQPFQ